MKEPIFKIQTGCYNAFIKTLKQMSFLREIQIRNSILTENFATNAWLCVSFWKILNWPEYDDQGQFIRNRKANFAFINTPEYVKELSKIPTVNPALEIYEHETEHRTIYEFTNGGLHTFLTKYVGFKRETKIPVNIDNRIEIGTTTKIDQIKSKTLFQVTKNQGPIEFIIVKGELVAVRNALGTRFPVVPNTLTNILETEPDNVLRSFSFDKFEGKTVELDLFKMEDDLDNLINEPCTWLHAQITIDTATTFNFFERLTPTAKHNWRT